MRYGSVCSGIEAASAAWHRLGWEPRWFAEIEAFPSAVLKAHYPHVRNYGDFTRIPADAPAIDLLVGGTPCQSFSIAGLRKGLGDDRGNLALEFLRLAGRLRPTWVLWENVPGVFSSISHDAPDAIPPEVDLGLVSDGQEMEVEDVYDAEESHAFACFLAGLSELGYGFAYRTLDAQHFGVPQRRRRVFVVGCLGDRNSAAAVLLELHSLSGHPAPSRKAREGAAQDVAGSLGSRGTRSHTELDGHGAYVPEVFRMQSFGEYEADGTGSAMKARDHNDATDLVVTHTLRGDGFDASEDGSGRGTPLVPCALPIHDKATRHAGHSSDRDSVMCFGSKDSGVDVLEDVSPTLRAGVHDKSHQNGGVPPAIAFKVRNGAETYFKQDGSIGTAGKGILCAEDQAFTLATSQDQYLATAEVKQVQWASGGGQLENDTAQALRSHAEHSYQFLRSGMAVRRLTPLECERLQGFPDNYTLVEFNGRPAADSPRYRALGNSMAVPVMRWIGERVEMVEAVRKEAKA